MYDLILTDNPWEYDNKQQNDPARGGITYPTLSMKDLYELDIGKLANDNALLISWVTFPKLVDLYYEKYSPLDIIRNWGFRPVTALFVWVKLNPTAFIYNEDNDPYWEEDKHDANCYPHIKVDDFYSGLGRYTNSNVEIAIVARKGKMLERKAKDVKQLIFAPIGKHSEKPREQYGRIHRLFGTDIKCIELFARKQNPPPSTWDATGLDFDGKDIREFIKEKINNG